jgi:hypothetical protein
MKHIEKRFFNQQPYEKIEEKLEQEGRQIELDDPEIVKKSENMTAWVLTDKGIVASALIHNVNGRNVIIPIPDLTLIYFNNAYFFYKQLKEQEVILLQKLSVDNHTEDATNEIFKFYGFASSSIIMIFTAIECFMNHFITTNATYSFSNRKGENITYNKRDIQRRLSTQKKIEDVYVQLYNRNLPKDEPALYKVFNILRQLRDEIVHTKSEQHLKPQEALLKEMLDFDYMGTIEVIADIMNYYVPGYIVECNCGVDF